MPEFTDDDLRTQVVKMRGAISHLNMKLSMAQEALKKAEFNLSMKQRVWDQHYLESQAILVENLLLSDRVARLEDGNREGPTLLDEALNEFWALIYPNNPNSWKYRTQPLLHIRAELEIRADRIKHLENMRRIDADAQRKALESLRERIARQMCPQCLKGLERAVNPQGEVYGFVHIDTEGVWPCWATWILKIPLVEEIPGEGVEPSGGVKGETR